MATNQVIVVVNADLQTPANGSAQATTSNAADALTFVAPLTGAIHPGDPSAYWSFWFMTDEDKATFVTQLGGALGPEGAGTFRVYDGAVTGPEAVLAAEELVRFPVGDV